MRYNYDREDVFSNSKDASVNHTAKSNVMLYPSGLVMGKATQTKDDRGKTVNRLTYTKHYYIGSERVSAKTGTIDDLGYYPATVILNNWSNLTPALATPVRAASTQSVTDARSVITAVKNELLAALPAMATSEDGVDITLTHTPGKLNIYYFHSDHLGSSSYMSNGGGTISQHMEYLPFGETMVEEHINSNNSPFKFNGKEFDEETGNYYYGARYYDPKWSIFTSVDPMAEQTTDAYGYCYQNPVRYSDPTGMMAGDGDYYNQNGKYLGKDAVDDNKVYVADSKNADGTFKNASTLKWASGSDILKKDFDYLSSVLHAEGSSVWEESAGIYCTMENRGAVDGTGIMEQATVAKGVFGAGAKERLAYSQGNINSANKMNARQGLIAALKNPLTDYSGGAYFWHGCDFDNDPSTCLGNNKVGAYNQFYCKGFLYTNSKHDIWGLGSYKNYVQTDRGNYSYMYKSTAAFGNTTFMKHTNSYLWSLYIQGNAGTPKRANELGRNPK